MHPHVSSEKNWQVPISGNFIPYICMAIISETQ
jgi:hypothetical protein